MREFNATNARNDGLRVAALERERSNRGQMISWDTAPLWVKCIGCFWFILMAILGFAERSDRYQGVLIRREIDQKRSDSCYDYVEGNEGHILFPNSKKECHPGRRAQVAIEARALARKRAWQDAVSRDRWLRADQRTA